MISVFSELPTLNLPQAELRIETDGTGRMRVWDAQRRRMVAMTPEEWVRQNFVEMLITVKGYMRGRVGNEVSVDLNGIRHRCDTVVFDSAGMPLMIVEYKSPAVAITQTVFDQIARYNMVLRAKYLVVSNGLSHYCCEPDYERGSYRFLRDIPAAGPEDHTS